MFCCFGGQALDLAFAKLDGAKTHKATVIGDDTVSLKRFFQHVRFLNEPHKGEEPLDLEELSKARFFVRRHLIDRQVERPRLSPSLPSSLAHTHDRAHALAHAHTHAHTHTHTHAFSLSHARAGCCGSA